MSEYFYPRKPAPVTPPVSLLTEPQLEARYIELREEGKNVTVALLTVMSEATGDQTTPPEIIKRVADELESDKAALSAVDLVAPKNAIEFKAALAAAAKRVVAQTWFDKLRLYYGVAAGKTDEQAFQEMKSAVQAAKVEL